MNLFEDVGEMFKIRTNVIKEKIIRYLLSMEPWAAAKKKL
jgi:hypothetical protein